MGSFYSLNYALDVALNGEDVSMREAFRSVPALSAEIFRQANEPDVKPVDSRATQDSLEYGLRALLKRPRHSDELTTHMEGYLEQVVNDILAAPGLVSGIMAWDRLAEQEESNNKEYFYRKRILDHVASICAVRMGAMGFPCTPFVQLENHETQRHGLKQQGSMIQNYVPHTTLSVADDIAYININTHPYNATMDSAYDAIGEVFSANIEILQRGMAEKISDRHFMHNSSPFRDDVVNLSTLFQEQADLSPFLYELRQSQFNVAFRNTQSSQFKSMLDDTIDQYGQNIVQRRSPFQKVSTWISYGSVNP